METIPCAKLRLFVDVVAPGASVFHSSGPRSGIAKNAQDCSGSSICNLRRKKKPKAFGALLEDEVGKICTKSGSLISKKIAKTEGIGAAVDLYGPVRAIGRFGAMLLLRKLEIEGEPYLGARAASP